MLRDQDGLCAIGYVDDGEDGDVAAERGILTGEKGRVAENDRIAWGWADRDPALRNGREGSETSTARKTPPPSAKR